MCGLYGGISTTLNAQDIEFIKQLGLVSQVRGLDSTGIALVYRKKKNEFGSHSMKDAVSASEFLYDPQISKTITDVKPFLIAGHVRSATVGDVNVANAHPFVVGRLLGMHNGTITGIEGKKADRTDSEALFNLIYNKGLQYAVNAARHGAYALVWIDGRNNTLNFIRNGQRTLYMMTAHGCIYWASEFYMLKMIADRQAMTTTEGPKLLEKDMHVQIRLDQPMHGHSIKKVEPDWSDLMKNYVNKDARTEVLISHTHIILGPTEEKDIVETPWKDNIPKSTKVSVPLVDPPPKHEHYNTSLVKYKAFRGKEIHLVKANSLLREGCAFCSTEVHAHQQNKALWFNNKQYLCVECAKDSFRRENVNAKKVYPGYIAMEKCSGSC